MSILKQRQTEFIASFTLSAFASAVIFLPPAIMFQLDDSGVRFTGTDWFICFVYIAFAWSYSIYLEQMLMAQLYLWQMKWEKEIRETGTSKIAPPKFYEIPKPSMLHDMNYSLAMNNRQ